MFTFSFNHVALSVKDVSIADDFYSRVLKLKEIENTASTSKTRWFALGEGKQLHLIPRPDAEIKTNKAVHFALAIDDITTFITHLNFLNIEYTDWLGAPSKDYIRNDGIRQFYFQDPDGYWIEVNEDF